MMLGFIGALVYLRVLFDRIGYRAKYQNLCIASAFFALVGGYFFSVLTQAVYNAIESGTFRISQDTGATFYGGLIGGAGVYLLVYFVGGRFLLEKGETKRNFWTMSSVAGGAVALAHGFGRIGCAFAGCCHGKVTDSWFSIYNVGLHARTVPVQLMETAFLFLLCAYLTWNTLRGKRNSLSLYLMLYAVWRFVIEYLRADERGATVVSFLSPSQLTAILLLIVGVLIFFLERKGSAARGDAHEA